MVTGVYMDRTMDASGMADLPPTGSSAPARVGRAGLRDRVGNENQGNRVAKLHARPSLQYRYEHYDPQGDGWY